jgi:DNA-binding Lrp family transcriptional regulator
VATSLKTLHKNDNNNAATEAKESEGQFDSRKEILEELEDMGVNGDMLGALSMESLGDLLNGMRNLVATHSDVKRGRPKGTGEFVPTLSDADKKIIHQLFSSEDYVPSLALSKELDIPLSTIQRRRKRLEDNLIERSYSLKAGVFGFRTATLFISTSDGKTMSIGKEILEMDGAVTSVTRTLGENAMDLRAEVVFKNNSDLLALIEQIKSLDGVRDVCWSESIELVGRNNRPYRVIIEAQ